MDLLTVKYTSLVLDLEYKFKEKYDQLNKKHKILERKLNDYILKIKKQQKEGIKQSNNEEKYKIESIQLKK